MSVGYWSMSKNDNEPSQVIELTLSDSNGTCIGSLKMDSDMPISRIREGLKLGDQTILSLVCYMMSLNYQRLEREMNVENSRVQSIVMPLNGYRFTFSLSRLLHISWLLETLVKRLEFLRQRLTPMGGSELHITSQGLRRVDLAVRLMTLELGEISRMLKNDYVKSSSRTRE